MSKTPKEEANTGAPIGRDPPVKAHSPKFTVERLRKDCLSLFGITFSTFDGATYELSGKYSVDEMCTIITTWQKKRVLPTEKKEDN